MTGLYKVTVRLTYYCKAYTLRCFQGCVFFFFFFFFVIVTVYRCFMECDARLCGFSSGFRFFLVIAFFFSFFIVVIPRNAFDLYFLFIYFCFISIFLLHHPLSFDQFPFFPYLLFYFFFTRSYVCIRILFFFFFSVAFISMGLQMCLCWLSCY